MHRLMVSDEVIDRLRALRLDSEQSEDHVLRRLLGCPSGTTPDGNSDFIDATYGVRFPEGFQIFRAYKGRPYSARVSNGCWVLVGETGSTGSFNSLNQLSQAVIDGNENAWMFWFYRPPGGEPRRIADLRDPAQVQRRPRRNRPKEQSREAAAAPLGPPPQNPRPTFQPEAASAPFAPPPAPGPVTGPGTTSISPRTADGKPWEPA